MKHWRTENLFRSCWHRFLRSWLCIKTTVTQSKSNYSLLTSTNSLTLCVVTWHRVKRVLDRLSFKAKHGQLRLRERVSISALYLIIVSAGRLCCYRWLGDRNRCRGRRCVARVVSRDLCRGGCVCCAVTTALLTRFSRYVPDCRISMRVCNSNGYSALDCVALLLRLSRIHWERLWGQRLQRKRQIYQHIKMNVWAYMERVRVYTKLLFNSTFTQYNGTVSSIIQSAYLE